MIAGDFESCVRRSDFSIKRLLETEFCSLEWVALSHAQRRDPQGRIFVCRKRGAYPVEGMIRCAVCGRSAPPDFGREMCVDCRVEIDVRRFHEWLDKVDRDDRLFLLTIYWRRPPRARDWLKEWMLVPQIGLDEGMLADASDRVGRSLINEADLFDGHLESDQKWGNEPHARDLRTQLRRRFLERYTTKTGDRRTRVKRRGAGCRKAMLDEGTKALQKEIDYYHAKQSIVPRARRVSNPYDRREQPLPMPGEGQVL